MRFIPTFLSAAAVCVTLAEAAPSKKELASKAKVVEFKEISNGGNLSLHIFAPENKETNRSCVVFFFGGGWLGGSPSQFFPQAAYFQEKGMVAISAQYRTQKSHKVKPASCVEDAKSAIRWVRANAKELGIDPNKIVAAGGSAGGHVACCTGVVEGFDLKTEDQSISSKPNAMVLFNPVLDTTSKGYGASRMKIYKTALSPCHIVKKGIVPTLVLHGDKDRVVPFENATRFTKLMKEAGNVCELEAYAGEGHGFFNIQTKGPNPRDKNYKLTVARMEKFLKEQGYLK